MNRPALAVINEDFPKVRNVDDIGVSGLLNYILALLNIKSPTDPQEIANMDIQMLLVGDLIRTEYGTLTIPEIKTAFKMYVSKQLEGVKVFRILDCISVGEVLTAFIEHRNESLRVYSEKKRTLTEKSMLPQVTDSEKLEILNAGIIRVFSEYSETKTMPEPNAYIFDELYQRKIIKEASTPTLQMYYQSKYDQAKNEIKAELKNEPAQSPNDLRNIRAELEKLESGQSGKVEIRTKRIILSEYFDKLIKNNDYVENFLK